MNDLSRRLKRAAKDKGLSNRQIADAAGVSPPTVDRMMNGTVRTQLENLDAVAEVLGIPIAEARRLTERPPGTSTPYTGPSESRLLSGRQRQAIDELIRSIVSARPSAGQDGEGWAGPWPTGDEDPGMGGDQEGEQGDQLGGG